MKRDKIALKNITMGSFVLCPFLIVVSDQSCLKEPKINITTISYVGVLSEEPPIIGLAIRPRRYSHNLIEKEREFTLNLPNLDMLSDVDFFGSHSGRRIHKATERVVELVESEIVKAPSIKAAPLTLECTLQEIMYLSKNGASHNFLIARVVAGHKKQGFLIEDYQGIVTTRYDYRQIGGSLGRAFRLNKKGG